MQLSNEDNLRLNVLLAQSLKAIRINEASMTIFALTDKGEAKIQLNPTTRDEQYMRWIRELISLKVTGSPGGYPVFLRSWTRMGHADNTLEHMLLLGEPEAIVAMVHAPTLTLEQGECAWWANPTIEVARRLLHYTEVVEGELGQELATYLLEFLPFEEEQKNIVKSVQLCLQGSLTTVEQRESLWKRAKRKNPFYVGFLYSKKNIPIEKIPHPELTAIEPNLADLIKEENPYALHLCELLAEDGQKWLYVLKESLRKPVDQDVVIAIFTYIGHNFSLPFPERLGVREVQLACDRSVELCTNKGIEKGTDKDCSQKLQEQLHIVLSLINKEHLPLLEATLMLAQLGEDTLTPIFAGNDSVGSVMRRKLEPLTTPILERVDRLMA